MNKIYLLKLWERSLRIHPNSSRKKDIEKIIEYIKQDV